MAGQQPTSMTKSNGFRLVPPQIRTHHNNCVLTFPTYAAPPSPCSFLDLSSHSPPTSLSPISSSSSQATFLETDDENESNIESNSDTDVDDEDYLQDNPKGREGEEDESYSYRLLPAMTISSFAPGPSSMDAPWPYTFKQGDTAYARTSSNSWTFVTLLDGGRLSTFSNSPQTSSFSHSHSRRQLGCNSATTPPSAALVYTAQWQDASGKTKTGTFCPTRGDLKPDDLHVKRLLAKEKAQKREGMLAVGEMKYVRIR